MDVDNLIKEIELMGIKNKKILNAIEKIPRHKFLPEHLKKHAYLNIPLHIGHEQTISQPYTVAFMLDALELKVGDKVLEVGSATGWSAALMSELVKPGTIYTTEIIPELAELAKSNLKKNKIKNVKVFNKDGSLGLERYKPFDKIVLTAAAPEIPKPLIEQLKNNGILVAPVGPLYCQEMLKLTKKDNKLKIKNLGDFIFVKLKGEYGY
jgi:protein-L-isoaspartate(D-aspartate) O-methyltransferase